MSVSTDRLINEAYPRINILLINSELHEISRVLMKHACDECIYSYGELVLAAGGSDFEPEPKWITHVPLGVGTAITIVNALRDTCGCHRCERISRDLLRSVKLVREEAK